MIHFITIRVTVNWNEPFVELPCKCFFHGLTIYPVMINDVSKHRTYFKEEKTLQNREKAFENQQNMFFIVRFRKEQERLPKVREYVRDRSNFWEGFLFLKKELSIFCKAFLSVFVLENFSLGC